MAGLFLLGGLSIAFLLAVPVLLVLAVLVFLALRHDDDLDGARAPALYGAVVAFVALLTVLFAATAGVTSLVSLTADDNGSSSDPFMEEVFPEDEFSGEGGFEEFEGEFGSFSERDPDDEAVSSAVVALIVAAVALAVLYLHRGLLSRRGELTGAGLRVYRGYLLTMSMVAVFLAFTSVAMLLYALFQLAAPGVTAAENRADTLRAMAPTLTLAIGAGLLFRWHWAQTGLNRRPTPPADELSAAAAP